MNSQLQFHRRSTGFAHCGIRRSGTVLIVVLVLVVMIALAGFGFLAEMTTEYEATRINGDLLQAQQVLGSAETWLLWQAEQQAQLPVVPDPLTDPENAAQFQAVTLQSTQLTAPSGSGPLSSVEAQTADDSTELVWRFAVVAQLPDTASRGFSNSDSEQISDRDFEGLEQDLQPLSFGLQNESARLHLQTLLNWEQQEPGRGRRALMYLPGMTEETADSLLDWIDADSEPREYGAEADYYQRLDRPSRPANALPTSLEELLFVKSVNRQAFAGAATADQEFTLGTETTATGGWRQHLTLVSAERNIDSTGQPRIAINAATLSQASQLEDRLNEFLPPELARYVVLARLFGISYVAGGGVQPLDVSLSSLSSASFSAEITNLSDLLETSVQLPQTLGGQLVNSPLTLEDSSSLQSFRLIEDRLTTASGEVLSGRINIHAASAEVLQALLDDPAMASQIVQQRQTLDETERQSTLWLVTRQVVDLPVWRRIYTQITTGGNVHSGEIIVYRPVGGPFLRRKVTIDAAQSPVRLVNWLDKSAAGLSVSIDQLEAAVLSF